MRSIVDYSQPRRKVLLFGSFDPFHRGHTAYLRDARKLGDYLIVVVARDAAIVRHKKRQPHQPQELRVQTVAERGLADEVILGDERPEQYGLINELDFTVLALGYDQHPDDAEVRRILDHSGKKDVVIHRLPAYKPEKYKSKFFRD